MAATVDAEKDVLRIGDLIFFKDALRLCNLKFEGILLEDVFETPLISNLFDSIFCVHLQRQYSASRDLNAFLENYNMNPNNIKDEGAKKYLLALQV
jgi:hypothetical protein